MTTKVTIVNHGPQPIEVITRHETDSGTESTEYQRIDPGHVFEEYVYIGTYEEKNLSVRELSD